MAGGASAERDSPMFTDENTTRELVLNLQYAVQILDNDARDCWQPLRSITGFLGCSAAEKTGIPARSCH